MKQILLMIAAVALVGCGKKEDGNTGVINPNKPSPKAIPEKLIADPTIVEKAVRKELEKPEGELTKADLEKVRELDLGNTQITDAGLKEIAKLQNLTHLYLNDTKITDEGAAEFQRALPKCRIFRNGVKKRKANQYEMAISWWRSIGVKKRKANEYEMAIFGQSATTGVQLTVQIEVPRDSNRSVWIDAEPLFWVTDGLQRAELVVDKQGNEILRLWLTTAGSRQFKEITSRYLPRNLFFLYPLPDPMQKGKFKACCVGTYRVDKVAAVQVLDVIPDASPEELKFIVEELNLKVRAK